MRAFCPPTGHVWSTLRPGYEPDLLTPCDCGMESFGEHQRKEMATALNLSDRVAVEAPASPPQPRWDIARVTLHCRRRAEHRIAAGEPYRLVTKANLVYCEQCSIDMFNEAAPADLPVVRISDLLKKPASHDDEGSPMVIADPAYVGHTQPTVTLDELRGRPKVDFRRRRSGEAD